VRLNDLDKKGNWAEFIDLEDITSKQRKWAMRDAANSDPYSAPDIMISHFLVAWSYNEGVLPTRGDKDCLDDVTAQATDTMTIHVNELLEKLTPRFDPNPDPASPTSPSVGSSAF
jgi:hypothetical protein